MTALFYIGSRSLNLLMGANAPGYRGGIMLLASVSALYTIFGGLKAVVWTDVLQSLLLLAAGILVAVLTFTQVEVGGFAGMLARDAALPGRPAKNAPLPAGRSSGRALDRCADRTPRDASVVLVHESVHRAAHARGVESA